MGTSGISGIQFLCEEDYDSGAPEMNYPARAFVWITFPFQHITVRLRTPTLPLQLTGYSHYSQTSQGKIHGCENQLVSSY